MTDRVAWQPGGVPPEPAGAGGVGRAARPLPHPGVSGPADAGGFAAALEQALSAGRTVSPEAQPDGRLKLSAHAAHRLQAAGIAFEGQEQQAVETAVARAAARGGRECLALTARAAYIVHIPSGTVVTAIAGDRLKEGVFTGIDSAVIATGELDR